MKVSKRQEADRLQSEYKEWKTNALAHFGYFPIFQPFKETHLLRNLSGNALKLYVYLGLYSANETGESWVSIDTMAAYFGKSTRTISNWVRELEKKKLIKRLQLEMDGVAYTMLLPYGLNKMDDPNSTRKSKNTGGN